MRCNECIKCSWNVNVLPCRDSDTTGRIPNCQLGETGGSGLPGDPSPTSNSNDTRFPEKNQVKITTLFKISDPSIEMYDILKPHWQITLAVPRFGSLLNSPNHLYLRMPRHIVPKIKKSAYIFLSTFCGFLTDSVLVDEVCDQRFYDVERLLVKYGYFTATGTAMPAVTALEGSFMLKMKRKTLFYTLFLPILLLTLSSIEIRAEGHETVGISEQSDLRLAAWNIRIMSNKSRK